MKLLEIEWQKNRVSSIWIASAIIKGFSSIYYNWWLADNPLITSTKFDSTMTLKPHTCISNIVRVSSFHIRNISRIRKYLNQNAEQIIHAFVTSRLDNGNALVYGFAQNQISHLQHIQNTAAHVVTLSRKSCHITPILKELHWLPVSQRIIFKLMLTVHKSVNNIAPIYISELFKVYTPSRNLRSSNMSLLKEPTSKRTWGDTCRSFSVAAPRLWNHLPTKLKSCHSITRFKSLLKTHLMSQFFKDDVYLWLHCTCILVHNFVFAITVNCLYSCFFFFVSAPWAPSRVNVCALQIFIIIIISWGKIKPSCDLLFQGSSNAINNIYFAHLNLSPTRNIDWQFKVFFALNLVFFTGRPAGPVSVTFS